jgi:hypothetical protein
VAKNLDLTVPRLCGSWRSLPIFPSVGPGNTKGGGITVPLTSCMTTDNFCFYLENRLIQTSQTGGQWYRDISPLVFSGVVGLTVEWFAVSGKVCQIFFVQTLKSVLQHLPSCLAAAF